MTWSHHRRGGTKVAAARHRSRGTSGESLIEVLFTVIVVALAVTALMTGLNVASRLAADTQIRTQTNTSLQNWAEKLQQPVTGPIPDSAVDSSPYMSYKKCDYGPITYGGPEYGLRLASKYLTPTITVRYLQGFDVNGTPQWGTSCPAGGDLGLQEITLTLNTGTSSHPSVDTLVVIKRETRCPTTYDNADRGPC